MNAPLTDLEIVPRHMGFEFPADTPKYWFAGEPWATHLLNSLSIAFPPGEAAFVNSVRRVKDRVTDPKLQAEMRAFTTQEMHHSKEHEAFNDWLRSLGLPVDSILQEITENITKNRKTMEERVDLAFTAALEHFTAILAVLLLGDPEIQASMHENVRHLWMWHAIEEIEHKAVAFDVFHEVGGEYRTRALVMAIVTVAFIFNTSRFHFRMLRADGELTNWKSAARYYWKFWGPRGYFTRLIPSYLEYYRRDFHPWQRDDRPLIQRFLGEIEARAKRIGPSSKAARASA